MANTPLSYKNDEQADDRLNPTELAGKEHAAGKASSGYAGAGIDQAEAYANDPANAVKEQEENPYDYSQGDDVSRSKTFSNLKGFFKKAGPTGGIIGLITAAFAAFSVLVSPGMAVVQIKELLTEDLNDQLTALDLRSIHVFKAKLKDIGSAGCKVNIKCKFKGMSDRQIKKFKAAGFEIETDKKTFGVPPKNKVTKIISPDGKEFNTPNEMVKALDNRSFRDQLRRAFNPKYAGFYDAVSSKIFKRYNTSKASKVPKEGTDEDRDKALVQSAQEGTGAEIDTDRASETDEDGKPISENQEANAEADERFDRIKSGGGFSKYSSVLKGGVKGIGILGVTDSACTVVNTSRAVMAAAKLYRKRQVVGFAMVFLTFADEVKAGTATPEQAEYIGNKLTAVDTEKMVIDETSDDDKKVPNPYYGKNAFDSEGYKAAAYNDAPDLTARANRFAVGGGLSGRMASILKGIGKAPSKKACSVIQNPFVRGGSLIVGIIAGIGSFGWTTAASVAGSAAISLALPLLEAYLTDMIKGTVVDKDTKGVDAGNAIFAGTAGLQGDVAMARGMKPATKDDLETYLAQSKTVKDEYIAMETEDAKKTPYDIYNQYSFLGSFARKLVPSTAGLSSNVAMLPSSVLDILGVASKSFVPQASAVGDWNPERYEKCDDIGYEDIGVDADIFCNVRYTMSPTELGMDTDTVVDYMLDKGYIDDEGKAVEDEDYADWLEQCVNREIGWGEEDPENDIGNGEECVKNKDDGGKYTEKQLSNFRVFTMDNGIADAMEYEGEQPPASGGAAKLGTLCTINDGSLNESSGLAASKKHPGIVYTHNDEGNMIYAINIDTCAVAGKFTVSGVRADPDPEAIQVDHKTGKIWFGDIGNGHPNQPKSMTDKDPTLKHPSWPARIVVFDEPAQFSGTITATQKIDITYQGGMQNSEALLINPVSGDGYIINKQSTSTIYKLPKPLSSGQATVTSTKINGWVTDAAFTPDGKWALIRYRTSTDPAPEKVYVYDAATWKQAGEIAVPKVGQGESITVEMSGKTFLIGSEGSNSPLVRVALPPEFGGDEPTSGGGGDVVDGPSRDGWVWPVAGSSRKDLKNSLLPWQGNDPGDHKGIDIGDFPGRDVLAAHKGTVTQSYDSGSCGYFVVIKAEGTSYWAAYQHLSKKGTHPKKGDPVTPGKVIGKIREAGESATSCTGGTFEHLHFSVETEDGISFRGSTGHTIDPLKVLP